MTINKALFSSARDNWETPQSFFDELHAEFAFDLDAAASESNTKCNHFFTIKDNALEQTWYRPGEGIYVIWCNPPYGRVVTGKWVKKFEEEANKGATVVALLPARTDTRWFHQYIWEPLGYKGEVQIRWIKGRLKFELDGKPILDKHGRPQSAPFPSMVVVWR